MSGDSATVAFAPGDAPGPTVTSITLSFTTIGEAAAAGAPTSGAAPENNVASTRTRPSIRRIPVAATCDASLRMTRNGSPGTAFVNGDPPP
jgi:hypothetical protein